MNTIAPEQLAFEIEDVIRTMPGPRDFVANPDKCIPWLGRASAAMSQWNSIMAIGSFEPLVTTLSRSGNYDFGPALRNVLVLLHQAKNDLRLQSTGPLSVGVDAGRVFEYFDEVRRVIEEAKSDVLFVDPYIDAEFVSRYMPNTHHLDMVRNADYDRGARNGLKSTAFTYHPTSALADGYSMVLAKAGRNRELVAFAERYFEDYAAPYNKAEDTLRRRM